MITKLFIISFISGALVGCVSKGRYSELESQLEETKAEKEYALQKAEGLEGRLEGTRTQLEHLQDQQRTQADLIRSLESEIEEGLVKISRAQERVTVSLVDHVLFDSGSSEIRGSGKDTLEKVSNVLKDTVEKDILVYGHTDNVPIGARLQDRFETNWELSTARATSVVRFLASEGVSESKMMAAGHAEFQPVATNETAEGRQQNRRIEIVLIPQIEMKRQ